MLSLCSAVILLANSFHFTYAYVDFGSETLLVEPVFDPTPIPHQLPTDLRQEILPSMITAVAPAVTIAPNGTEETIYSLHYHRHFRRTRQGQGIFKRGVFANDPPLSTCKPCGGSTNTSTGFSNTSSCVLKTYTGAFQYPDPQATTDYCYDSNYGGVFKPSPVTDTGLPCCFTIPESCLRNATTSSSFTYSSGVFRSTSTVTFSTTNGLNATTTANPSYTFTLSTATSTRVGNSSISASQSSSSFLSTSSSMSASNFSSSDISNFTSSSISFLSGIQLPVLPSLSTSGSSTISTVTVISGTTIVVTTSALSTESIVTTSTVESSLPYVFSSSSMSESTTASGSISEPVISTISRSTSSFISGSGSNSNSGSTSNAESNSSSSTVTESSLSYALDSTSGSVSRPMIRSGSHTSSVSTSVTTQTSSYSIIVISSTTITITPTSKTRSASSSGSITAQSTITIITATPSTTPFTPTSYRVTVAPNTIMGCGTASGSGHVNGSGTVFFGSYSSVVSSGTASGSAVKVIGCGTLVATTGSFNGSATIIGCGSGSGTGDITGTGTVWPAQLGGLISFVTSGTAHNVSGAFKACGTLTGSGFFTATEGPTITLFPSETQSTRARSTTTIEVYVSYCPDSSLANGLPQLGTNFSSSGAGTYRGPNTHSFNASGSDLARSSLNFTVPSNSSSSTDNALCNTCPNSVGICCPWTVQCDDEDGKCPQYALELSSNTLNGYLIAQVMNSTAPVAGRRKVRALTRRKSVHGSGYQDTKELDVKRDVDGSRERERLKKRRMERRDF